jgi:hypothetical protein
VRVAASPSLIKRGAGNRVKQKYILVGLIYICYRDGRGQRC